MYGTERQTDEQRPTLNVPIKGEAPQMTQNIINTMINGLTVGILTARSLAFCAFIAVAHCVNTVMVQYVIYVAIRNY